MYVVTNKYTYEEHKKAILFSMHATKKIRLSWIYSALFYIVFWAVGGFFIGYGIMLAGVVIGLAVIAATVLINIKKSFFADKLCVNREDTISFYDSFLKVENERSYFMLKYDDIDEIWESKTNFYAKYGLDGKISIVKNKCPEGLIEFIRSIKKD